MKWLLISILFAGLFGIPFVSKNKTAVIQEIVKEIKGSYSPVALLELFTSEGCSSCPPADNLLPQLAQSDPKIISLSFHVDYWNRLGWTDPFSRHEFSERQRNYARQFSLETIYTPQLVVNGAYQMVGCDRDKAVIVINKVLNEKAGVKLDISELKITGNNIQFEVLAKGLLPKTELLAAIVQKSVIVHVKAGENRGATLSHTNVVRSFTSKTASSENSFEMGMPKNIDSWQLVVYAQQKENLKINGAIVFQPVIH